MLSTHIVSVFIVQPFTLLFMLLLQHSQHTVSPHPGILQLGQHQVQPLPQVLYQVQPVPQVLYQVQAVPQVLHQIQPLPQVLHQVQPLPQVQHQVQPVPQVQHQVQPVPQAFRLHTVLYSTVHLYNVHFVELCIVYRYLHTLLNFEWNIFTCRVTNI